MKLIDKMLIAVAMLLVCGSMSAQSDGLASNQRVIGHTVTDDIDYTGVMVGEAGTYTMGAYLTAADLAEYQGCKVIGIRVAVAQDLGRVRMVLNSPDASGRVQQLIEQRQRLYEGWNNVFFNGYEYDIDGSAELFYGFDYVETPAMVSADRGGLCSVGYDTDNSFVLYQDGDYYGVSNAGKLCVQLIVDVSNMPREQASVSYMDYGFKYKTAGEGLEVFALINNVGLDKATSLEIACSIDGGTPVLTTVECNLEYGQNISFEHVYPLDNYSIGGHEVTLYVTRINGHDYANGQKRARSANFALYSKSVERNAAFIEMYSDQNNYLTPKLIDGFETVKADLGSKAIVVNTMRPTNTLGVEDAAYLHELYAYTWPSFTVNRSHYPGETYVAYDLNDYLMVFPGDMVSGILEELVMQDAETPSFGGIEISGEVVGDRELKVKVSGEMLEEAIAIYGQLALTVLVTEDDVRGIQMTENGRQLCRYNDLLRGYLTAPAGKDLPTNAGAYNAELSMSVPADWNVDNLKVVGLLTQAGEPSAARLYDFDITNAAQAAVVNNMAGVENVLVDRQEDNVYYNLQGIPVAKPTNGIYILNGKKVYVK